MITEEEALTLIINATRSLPSRRLPLEQVDGKFAARDVVARIALPGFDNSAMDGYAVVARACVAGQSQRVIGEQPAGVDRALRIQPGEAVRIFTGAPIPKGADAVVMQEDARREGDQVFISAAVEPGEFIRRRGSDLTEGQKILSAGARIWPQTMALLASQGFAEVEVGGEVRVAIITTGDELVPPGGLLTAGQLYESNSILIQSLCREYDVAVDLVEHCPDAQPAIEAALRKGMERDIVVVIGGVSVGARDLVRPALASVGAETDLWRVSVKPGKPFLFGRANRCAIFGLPGNPVSAFMTFLLFVRPAILQMMGAGETERALPRFEARLGAEVRNESDRPHYVRGRFGQGTFTPIGRQESHALYGLSLANALLRVPPGIGFSAGTTVSVLGLRE